MTDYIKLGMDILEETVGRNRAIDYHNKFFTERDRRGLTAGQYMMDKMHLPPEQRQNLLAEYQMLELKAWGTHIREVLGKHNMKVEGDLERKLKGEQ